MTHIHHFDFCESRWIDIADTLCEFRNTANAQCAYAYVKTTQGLQLSMVERLVADLDLQDHICMETAVVTAHCAKRQDGRQQSHAHLPFGLERLWSKSVPRPVVRLG